MSAIDRFLAAILLAGAVGGSAAVARHLGGVPESAVVHLAPPPAQHLTAPGAVQAPLLVVPPARPTKKAPIRLVRLTPPSPIAAPAPPVIVPEPLPAPAPATPPAAPDASQAPVASDAPQSDGPGQGRGNGNGNGNADGHGNGNADGHGNGNANG